MRLLCFLHFFFFIVFFSACNVENSVESNMVLASLVVTGLSDDLEAKRRKEWSWSCSDPPCVYRYAVNVQSVHTFSGNDSFEEGNTASIDSHTGTYYLHVQARNEDGDESLVHTVKAIIDNKGPVVNNLGVRVPSSGLYERGVLNFSIEFSESVQVKLQGSRPRLSLLIGNTTVYANYTSGTGTEVLNFAYEILGGERDDDGITFLTTAIDLNSGKILDLLGNEINNTEFTAPSMTEVRVNARRPYPIKVVVGPGYKRAGQTVVMTATFNESVYINISLGKPRLKLAVSNKMAYAEYVGQGMSGQTHTFHYEVSPGENDSDGLEVMGMSLNGGAVVNILGHSVLMNLESNVLASVVENGVEINRDKLIIDTTPPMVTGLTGDFIPRKSYDWNWGCNEEGCTYRHIINNNSDPHSFSTEVGGVYGNVQSASASANDGRFYIHVRVKDLAGNESAAFTASTMLDNTAPTLVNTELGTPINSTYSQVGDQLDFTLNFNERVLVTTIQGSPAIPLLVGSQQRSADYVVGADPLVAKELLTFRYVVKDGDEDNNGIEVSQTTLQLNNAVITDRAGNIAVIANFTVPILTQVLVDARAPTLESVTTSYEGGYSGGDRIALLATFSERVNVMGIPQLTLAIDQTSYMAAYTGGAPGKVLFFEYDVLSAQNDSDGIEVTGIDLSNNDTTIRDNFNRDVVTVLSSPFLVTGAYVDNVAPTLSQVSLSSRNYREQDQLDITLDFSEVVYVEEDGINPIRIRLTFDTGGSKYAEYSSGSGTQQLVFRYTIETGVRDANGVTMASTVDLNGGVIRDGVYQSYNSSTSFTLPSNLNQVLVVD